MYLSTTRVSPRGGQEGQGLVSRRFFLSLPPQNEGLRTYSLKAWVPGLTPAL